MSEPRGLAVLFEDDHVVAVAKPAGLLTQGFASGGPTLEDALRRHLDPSAPGSVFVGTVHRLDRPVSGVVLWAKSPKAARRLSAQFARRQTVKEYWAVVETHSPAPDPGGEGAWDDWLVPSTDSAGVVRAAGPGAPVARRAVTRFRREGEGGPPSRVPDGTVWLRLWPETGRTHQLRAQAALRGLPVLGDALYGASRGFARGIALHARSLTFEHPTLRGPVTVTAPPPEDWPVQGIALPVSRS